MKKVRTMLGALVVIGLLSIFGSDLAVAHAVSPIPVCHIEQTTPEVATLFVEGLKPPAPHQGYRAFLFAPSGALLFIRAYNPPGGSEPFRDPEHGTYEGQVWLVKGEGAEHNSFTKVKELATCFAIVA